MFLHLFNPGHETAILHGSPSYTPPVNVQKMQKDLELLPVWYGQPGDYVLVKENIYADFFSSLPQILFPLPTAISPKELSEKHLSLPEMVAAPWGLSPDSLRFFRFVQKESWANIIVPEWKEEYVRLTGRQTAAECLDQIRKLLPEYPLPLTPIFCQSVEEIETYITQNRPPFVLKTPYSSSGRGLLWIEEKELSDKEKAWINGAINKQSCISIEQGLDKVQDFAMEFYINDQGEVRYEGLSVFGTAERGAYTGNRLVSQEKMLKQLTTYISDELFEHIQITLQKVLQQVYGTIYTGFIGVDMMIYKKENAYFIHPCIEVNMRYTMGMVAVRLFQNLIAENAQGNYFVTYNRTPGEAYKQHLQQKEAYPLVLKNGRIEKGYLCLCPVFKETNYRAYILI